MNFVKIDISGGLNDGSGINRSRHTSDRRPTLYRGDVYAHRARRTCHDCDFTSAYSRKSTRQCALIIRARGAFIPHRATIPIYIYEGESQTRVSHSSFSARSSINVIFNIE